MIKQAAQLEPGIYRNMPDEDYRALPYMSQSDLKKAILGGSDIDPAIAEFGTAFHMGILEPERFAKCIYETSHRRNSKGWAKEREELGKHAITFPPGKLKKLREMAAGVNHHQGIQPLRTLANEDRSQCEVTVVAELEGVMCKCRIDQVHERFLLDWKTTSCQSSDDFVDRIVKYYYDVQAWWYSKLWETVTGEHKPLVFVCVGNIPPFPCWITKPADLHLDYGERTALSWLDQYTQTQHSIEHEGATRE